MWVERTAYFAKPGMAGEVLATRRRASAVRAGIGLPVGTIFVSAGGDGPDVRWECSFPSAGAHAADLAARAASMEFEAVRARMRTLLAVRARGRVHRWCFAAHKRDGDAATAWRAVGAARDRVPIEQPRAEGIFLHTAGGGAVSADGAEPRQRHRQGDAGHIAAGVGVAAGELGRRFRSCRTGTATAIRKVRVGARKFPRRSAHRNTTRSLPRGWIAKAKTYFAACELAAALPEVRTEHIGVMGSSFGGVNTLLSASKSKRLQAAAPWNSPARR